MEHNCEFSDSSSANLEDTLSSQEQKHLLKETEYANRVVEVQDQMEWLRSSSTIRVSELERRAELQEKKIQHLSEKLNEY